MEEALVAKLLASAAVVALTGQRITWGQRQQAAGLPAIVLHVVDRVPTYSGEGDAGLDATRVQINCLAQDQQGPPLKSGSSQAILLSRAVRAALINVSMVVSGVTFQGVFPENIDNTLFPEEVAGVTVYGRSLDYQLWHLT